MLESKYATWLNVFAAFLSALAALTSIYFLHLQTELNVAEKRVRPRVEWLEQNNSNFSKFAIRGSIQYIRDISASTYFVISTPFRDNRILDNQSVLGRKIIVKSSIKQCNINNSTANSEIGTCLIDMELFRRVDGSVALINKQFSDCLQYINASFYADIVPRIKYLDYAENKQSEYMRLIPLS